jgi:hypothetical protein
MTENLGCVVDQFLGHKRTLGRTYDSGRPNSSCWCASPKSIMSTGSTN